MNRKIPAHGVNGGGSWRRAIAVAAFVLCVSVSHGDAVSDNSFWPPPSGGQVSYPKIGCKDLRSLTGYEFSIFAADLLPANGDTQEYCRVSGQVLPEIRFEIALPSKWNGRFLMTGNGGFAGEPADSPPNVNRQLQSVRRGFIWAYTNTGHATNLEPTATFARDPQKFIDYGFRSLHVTAEITKQLAAAYYGVEPARSYFQGCSTGGREALILAQRFPRDFDGIVAGAPILNFTGTMIEFAYTGQILSAAPIPAAKQHLLSDRIYAECDSKDGLKDGIIDDPRVCDFRPARDLPQCPQGRDEPNCFTTSQVQTIEKLHKDIEAHGQRIFPGWPVGAEAFSHPVSGWNAWLLDYQGKSKEVGMAEDFFRYMVAVPPDPTFDISKFDLDKDLSRLARAHAVLDAVDTDLSQFHKRGGKLLMFHGWADQALNPLMSVGYYENVHERMGISTPDFIRLFMVPGMFHCGGGMGATTFDQLGAIVNWVEGGIAPDRIVASRIVDGKTILTRPLCPYPKSAKYRGAGSTDDARNFDCVEPVVLHSSKDSPR